MKSDKDIDSISLEDSSEDLSANDILIRFVNIGLRIGKKEGVCGFWDYDSDLLNSHNSYDSELDSIYQSACAEKELWSEGETAEYKYSISLVIHSIEALRGDMKAAILATSKIGIFSQYEFSDWVEEKEKDKRDKKAKESSSKGGKHSPVQERDELIFKIFNIKISGRKYNGSMGRNLKLHAKDMLGREEYTKDFPLLEEICNLKDDAIRRIIARKTANK